MNEDKRKAAGEMVSQLRSEAAMHQTVYADDRRRKQLFTDAADMLALIANDQPSSPAPVNTQGGGLREALKALLFASENADETGYVTDTGFLDLEGIQENARKVLAQAEQGQPAPAIGLSIKDALLQLREASGNVLVALSIDVALNPAKPDVPDSYRTSFNAFAHMSSARLETARGYTLPGVLTKLLAKLSPAGQPDATSIEEVNALVAGAQ